MADRDGGVAAGGGAPYLGGLTRHVSLDGPVVSMAPGPRGAGYWLLSAGGSVFSLGDAVFYGRAGLGHSVQRSGSFVGIAATSDRRGYWLVSTTGEVYSFGDARFYGSARPGASGTIEGIAATPGGGGYWLFSSSGGVFCFGDASYRGSAAGSGQKIVGFAASPGGQGYWLATATGRLLAYGGARAWGTAPGRAFVGMAGRPGGGGYWLLGQDGSVYGRGPARRGTTAALAPRAVAIAADPVAVFPNRAVPARGGATLHLRPPAPPLADRAGEAAARFALRQVGKAYLWGGTGPGAYDCSGLAMMSWAAARVRLPRTAAEQYFAGAHVALSRLRPGDLVFWASDPSEPSTIYHVGISLGGDRTVQATQPGQGVQVVDLQPEDLVPLATQP